MLATTNNPLHEYQFGKYREPNLVFGKEIKGVICLIHVDYDKYKPSVISSDRSKIITSTLDNKEAAHEWILEHIGEVM